MTEDCNILHEAQPFLHEAVLLSEETFSQGKRRLALQSRAGQPIEVRLGHSVIHFSVLTEVFEYKNGGVTSSTGMRPVIRVEWSALHDREYHPDTYMPAGADRIEVLSSFLHADIARNTVGLNDVKRIARCLALLSCGRVRYRAAIGSIGPFISCSNQKTPGQLKTINIFQNARWTASTTKHDHNGVLVITPEGARTEKLTKPEISARINMASHDIVEEVNSLAQLMAAACPGTSETEISLAIDAVIA